MQPRAHAHAPAHFEADALRRLLAAALIVGLAVAGLAGPAFAALKAEYRFQGNYEATGGAPNWGPIGDIANVFRTETVNAQSRTVLAFACNSGVAGSVAGVIPRDAYTIAVLFRFANLQSWARIIDFNDGAGDDGLYALNGALQLYPLAAAEGIQFAPDRYAQVVVTRSSDGQFRGYVNGALVIEHDDSATQYALIKDADVLRFFRDNDGGGGPTTEASAGAVSRIRLYDHVMTPAEVAGLDDTPPVVVDSNDLGSDARCDVTPPAPDSPTPRFDAGGTADVRRIAIQVCQHLFDQPRQARSVILARNDVFADALAGSPLAGNHSCVLYNTGGRGAALDAETGAEIDRAIPPGGKIRILGGEAAVSAQVEATLVQRGYDVERLWGGERVETAVNISRVVRAENPGNRDVLLAWAENFPDAVTGGAYGARTGTPILLTYHGELHPRTRAAMTEFGVNRTLVLGGTAVISNAAMGQAPNPTRYSGPNRMGTATDVATRLWGQVTPAVSTVVVVNIERADGWTLALAAAPLSARLDAPQIGVWSNSYPPETRAYLQDLNPRASRAFFLGNTEIISDAVLQQVSGDLA